MSSYTCHYCGKLYSSKDSLDPHIKAKHREKDGEVQADDNGNYTNRIERYGFGHLSCNKFGQVFGNQELLEHQIREKKMKKIKIILYLSNVGGGDNMVIFKNHSCTP